MFRSYLLFIVWDDLTVCFDKTVKTVSVKSCYSEFVIKQRRHVF